MFDPQLNYFSLLIPLFLMVVTLSLFVLNLYRKLSDYMCWFAVAILMAVAVQFLQTMIMPQDIYAWATFLCLLFFFSVLCTSHAVYLRLGIPTRWTAVLAIVFFAEMALAYFSFVQPNLDARLSIVALSSFLISVNNPKALLHSKPLHFLDLCLKYSLCGMILTIILRAVYMVAVYDQTTWILNKELIWAMTQFLMLFFSVVMITIFVSCSINDKLMRLHNERNLDPLTGMLNRRALDERLVVFTQREIVHHHALLMCDIDHFKKINDQYGHHVGDLALQHVARIMNACLRKHDEIARIGGEEFQIILHDVRKLTAITIAERIRVNIESQPLIYQGQRIVIHTSIGISYFQQHNYSDALKQADLLLYQAKNAGRNNVQSTLFKN